MKKWYYTKRFGGGSRRIKKVNHHIRVILTTLRNILGSE